MLSPHKKFGFKFGFLSAAILAGGLLVSCGGAQQASDGGGTTTATPAESTDLALGGDVSLNGAGASFPEPLYQRWFQEFSNAQSQVQVNYQGVGSGAGVRQFTEETVDFGASDVAMSDEEMAAVGPGVILLPMTAGSIVLAYNLPGIESGLQLSREAYVDILLGNITQWNDPAIADANPDLELPDTPITVVHRADGSGTTGVFTKHLSAISPEWEQAVGAGKTVEWGTAGGGNFVGANKNGGVAAEVDRTPGAIGYIEYAFAKLNDIPFAALENKAGNFILPTDESASETLGAVELPENLRAFITDPDGDNSYPVVTYTWVMAYQQYDDADKAKVLEAAIEFGLNRGQEIAPELGYIPLPQNVRERVAAAADSISPDYSITVR